MGIAQEHNWIRKSQQKPKSLRLAINAACTACFGGTLDELPDPGWKKEIRDCTGLCPLVPVRPYQGTSDLTDDATVEDDNEQTGP
jgi:hypothetical protein